MAINSDSIIPQFCKNCTHRFVCSIQVNFRTEETDITNFNKDNASTHQSIIGASYTCLYKKVDTTV